MEGLKGEEIQRSRTETGRGEEEQPLAFLTLTFSADVPPVALSLTEQSFLMYFGGVAAIVTGVCVFQ